MQKSSPNRQTRSLSVYVPVLVAFFLLTIPSLIAQESSSSELTAFSALPEAPMPREQVLPVGQPRQIQADVQPPPPGKAPVMASTKADVIEPWEIAPPLTAHDKRMLGLRDTVAPMALAGWLFSAGYGQLVGTPHYGSDRGAFGERLGAAALRDISETVLTDAVAAPIFHQDPRYYRLGNRRSLASRISTAGIQPFWTHTDSGRRAVNVSLMAGTMGGSALTNAYYPARDRGVGQTFETFAFSMAGSAVGNLVREFLPDLSGLFFSRIH